MKPVLVALFFLSWAAAAQTAASPDTPLVSHPVVSELSGVFGDVTDGISAVTAAGDVFVLLLGPDNGQVTKLAGDPASGSARIGKVSAAGNVTFVLQLGGVSLVRTMVAGADGNVFVAGNATASGLPVTAGAYRTTSGGDQTPFVCKLSGTDGTPRFCTYLDDNLMQLAALGTDAAGNSYVVARRNQSPVAATPGAVSLGSRNVLAMKLDAAGSHLLFAAEFGGSFLDLALIGRILVDSGGNIYIGGSTDSPDLPGGAASPLPGPSTIKSQNIHASPFVTKLNSSGTAVIYTVYGRPTEDLETFAVSSLGEVHTLSLQAGGDPLFVQAVRKYTADGTGVAYEKPLPIDEDPITEDPIRRIAVDGQGVAHIAGSTTLIAFPVHNSTGSCPAPGEANPYLVRLSPAGDLLQTTYLASVGSASVFDIGLQPGAGFIAASMGTGLGAVGVIRIEPAAGDTAVTALGCYGNGATFQGGALAPGEIFSIFGEGLGPDSPVTAVLDGKQALGGLLGGVQVTFDGTPAPLVYTQGAQINAVAPFGLGGKPASRMCVSFGGRNSCTNVTLSAAAPGIFQYLASDGRFYAAARNAGTSVNGPANPAHPGQIVELYTTGLGPLSPAPADGAIIQPPLPNLVSQVTATSPGPGLVPIPPVPIRVVFAGPAPFQPAGVYQVNVEIPQVTSNGTVPLELTLMVQTPDGATFRTKAFVAVHP